MKNLTKWSLDQAHSEISFTVRHLTIANIKGRFTTFDASIYTTEKNFTIVEIDLFIDAASISTGDAKRDEHLKGADFLDCENHKQISFTSITLGPQEENNTQELWGELTIKGIKKNVKLTAKYGGMVHDPWGNEKVGFSVTGTINRSDFGLVWNTALDSVGFLLSDEVVLNCEVELLNGGEKYLTMKLESAAEKK